MKVKKKIITQKKSMEHIRTIETSRGDESCYASGLLSYHAQHGPKEDISSVPPPCILGPSLLKTGDLQLQ